MSRASQRLFVGLADTLRVDLEHDADHLGSCHFGGIRILRQQVAVGQEEVAGLQRMVDREIAAGYFHAFATPFRRHRFEAPVFVTVVTALQSERFVRSYLIEIGAVLGGKGDESFKYEIRCRNYVIRNGRSIVEVVGGRREGEGDHCHARRELQFEGCLVFRGGDRSGGGHQGRGFQPVFGVVLIRSRIPAVDELCEECFVVGSRGVDLCGDSLLPGVVGEIEVSFGVFECGRPGSFAGESELFGSGGRAVGVDDVEADGIAFTQFDRIMVRGGIPVGGGVSAGCHFDRKRKLGRGRWRGRSRRIGRISAGAGE